MYAGKEFLRDNKFSPFLFGTKYYNGKVNIMMKKIFHSIFQRTYQFYKTSTFSISPRNVTKCQCSWSNMKKLKRPTRRKIFIAFLQSYFTLSYKGCNLDQPPRSAPRATTAEPLRRSSQRRNVGSFMNQLTRDCNNIKLMLRRAERRNKL